MQHSLIRAHINEEGPRTVLEEKLPCNRGKILRQKNTKEIWFPSRTLRARQDVGRPEGCHPNLESAILPHQISLHEHKWLVSRKILVQPTFYNIRDSPYIARVRIVC